MVENAALSMGEWRHEEGEEGESLAGAEAEAEVVKVAVVQVEGILVVETVFQGGGEM